MRLAITLDNEAPQEYATIRKLMDTFYGIQSVGDEYLATIATQIQPPTAAPLSLTPSPAPPPAAPAAPSSAAILDLDAERIPWDSRIHASTKTKTKAGTWTRRKGLDDATFKKIRDEIAAAVPAPTAAAAPAGAPLPLPGNAPPLTSIQPPPPPPPIQRQLSPDGLYEWDGQAWQPIAAGAPAAVAAVTWPEVCQVMNRKMGAGVITPMMLDQIAAKYSVTPWAMLSTRQDLWAAVKLDLEAIPSP